MSRRPTARPARRSSSAATRAITPSPRDCDEPHARTGSNDADAPIGRWDGAAMHSRSLISPLAVALAACAIAPAVGSAAPIIEGQGVAAGGGPGVTAKQFESQNLTAPDQVDRVQPTTNAPTW